MISLVTICLYTKLLQYYWLYPLCCILYLCDFLTLKICVCWSHSPVLPPPQFSSMETMYLFFRFVILWSSFFVCLFFYFQIPHRIEKNTVFVFLFLIFFTYHKYIYSQHIFFCNIILFSFIFIRQESLIFFEKSELI